MCQSKENGGKRCNGNNPYASNWPAVVDVDSTRKEIVIKADSFESHPALSLHAAVLSARTGFPLSQETIQAARKVAGKYDAIPKKQIWEQWDSLLLAEKPSAGLEAIHAMGWEENFPELAAIRGVPQSPIWHPEGSVEIHTAQAADVAAERAREEGLGKLDTHVAVMGAICHDLGKAEKTHIDENGKITSQEHDDAGYPLAISFLESIGASKEVKKQVPLIVREHMCHANKPTPKNIRRLITRLDNEGNGTTLEAWARVAEADRKGRGSAGDSGVSKKWLELKAKLEKAGDAPRRILDGKMMMAHSKVNPVEFGEIIRSAYELQREGVINSEADALNWLKENNYAK